AGYLSAGQRRRLALARLVAAPRPIWLLDEPTAALDTAGQERLGELMRTHLAGGGLIIAATHGPLGVEAEGARVEGAGGGASGRASGRASFAASTAGHRAARVARGGRGSMTPLGALLVRDMRIAVRIGGGALIGVLFFLAVVTLTPFAVGPDLALLRRIGPAILWLGALLASLLALDRLFAADHEDGSLDLILMGAAPLELTVAVKALAHWLTTGVPLVAAVPVLGLLLDLDPLAIGAVA